MICCRSKLDNNSFNTKIEDKPKTPWISVYLATLFIFLEGIQFSMMFVSMWPYLNTIDKDATATFFGFITGAYSLGQAFSSPLLGLWMNKTKSVKPPVTTTLTLMFLSNLIYASMELFPSNRRYIMFASRLLIGVASGDIAALRAYCASAAVPKDRPRAVVLTSAAWSCGLTIGPAFPVIFTPLGYPGLKLFGHMHFDMYTAPAWISALNNIISMILLHTIFKEEYNGVDQKDNKSEESNSTDLSQVKSKTNWLAITVCLISRFAFMLVYTNNETIGSLFSMTMYDWTNTQAVKFYGIIQLGQSGVNFAINIFYIFWLGKFLDKRNLERGAITFGLFCMLLFHILTFPWPFWNNKLTYSISHANQTATEISGCYTQTYSWCPSTHQVPLVLYGFSMVLIMGMGFGGAFSSNNILYSKVLGNIRQGTMTGILFMVGSIARTIGPVIVSTLFDHYGPEITWIMEIVVLSFTIALWIIFYKKMKPFKNFSHEAAIDSCKSISDTSKNVTQNEVAKL